MKKLADMSADEILQELSIRADTLKNAEEEMARAVSNFEAYEAATAAAIREHTTSDAQAQRHMKMSPEWAARYLDTQKAVIAEKDARRRYRICEHALDVWRTEQATLRSITR